MPPPVYPAEIAAGLAPLVAANASVAYAAPLSPGPLPGSFSARATAAAEHQFDKDLVPVRSLLASTGFNLNWDFFTAADTWAARKTPVNKPVNLKHDRSQVLGHAVGSEVVGSDGEVVAADAAPPGRFDVFDTSVLYKYTSPAGQKERDRLLLEVAQGHWWVSMEVLFEDFDYILVPAAADATQADLARAVIVERNPETAVLTKCLSAYNGTGKAADGRAIGRVLRKLTFAGKGLVENPANPSSALYALDGTQLSQGDRANASATAPFSLFSIEEAARAVFGRERLLR